MKNTFLHISKFLIIGLILNALWLGAFSQLSNAEGENTIGGAISGAINTATEATTDALNYAKNSEELKKAQEELVAAKEKLASAQEEENKASNALKAKEAEKDANKKAIEEKGQTLASYQKELKSLNEELLKPETKEPRKTEINTRITELGTGTPPGQGLIDKLKEEIKELQANPFDTTQEQTVYKEAHSNTEEAKQKILDIEAKIKKLEAENCSGTTAECDQLKIDAENAALAAEQTNYDKTMEEYNNYCKPDFDETTLPSDKKEICDQIKSELDDFENRRSQVLSAEQKLYKYQTLKELTFDVESVLDIDSMIVDEQKNVDQKKPYFNDPSGNTPIVSFILRVIDFAIRIIGSIAVLIIIIAGFILVVSVGNDTRIEQGKNAIKYAIVGLVVAFMSYTIVLFVQAIFSN